MAIEAITLGPKLATALVAAYKELRNPTFDTDNTYFESRYASLPACRDAAIPILAKHGVTLMQDLTTTRVQGPGEVLFFAVECRTILLHESGEGVAFGPFTLPSEKPTAQGLGSAATYSRRYALTAVTALAGDDDDDGNTASGTGNDQRAPHDRPTAQCSNKPPDRNEQQEPLADPAHEPTSPRPTGPFGYGKKYRDTPWGVIGFSQPQWFSEQPNTPRLVREKCLAEMAWRTYELTRADVVQG